jgi:hypothetical protein
VVVKARHCGPVRVEWSRLGDAMTVTRRHFLVAIGLVATTSVEAIASGAVQKSRPKLATVTLTIDGMI